MAKPAFIAPDFFSVAPELIGLPLASPKRRAVAMAIDLFLIAALSQIGGVFLGIVAGLLLWRASSRGTRGGFFRESVRLGLRATAALVLFIVVMASWDFGEDKIKSAEQALVSFAGDDDADDDENPNPNPIAKQDSGAAADTVIQDSAQARIAQLEKTNVQLREERDRARAELARVRERRSVRSFLGVLSDDFGLGFGWAAVYFTGFLSLMRGQTPGKRIMKMRVIRLDGKPLGWWISFERFGGYAASFSVGLLGFLQILWDRNRQGLHDKACETVVVMDSRQAAARS